MPLADESTKESPSTGHNAIAPDGLRSIVERIERLEEERKGLGSDINDIYIEAHSAGFHVKVLRQLIRIRKLDAAEVEEQESLLETYKHALGMLSDTPLGEAAVRRAAKRPDKATARLRKAAQRLHDLGAVVSVHLSPTVP